MAEPISAAAAAVATWVANAVFAAVPAGVSVQAAATIANLAYITAYAATTFALNAAVIAGMNALVQSSLPDPEGQKVTRKQPRPMRCQLVGGYSRFSGAYMLREATGTKLGVVLALAEGRLADISGVYLNDDLVTLDEGPANGWVQEGADGRYGGGDLIRIETRLGEPTEAHYGFLTADFSTVWPTTARGDGIASLGMWCTHRSQQSQSKLFPNGEPIPSVVGRPECYDWRQDSTAGGDGAQRRDDPSTWGPCANPVVWTVFVEWYRHGRNWDRCIAPVLADLTAEADYCDTEVLSMGGPEPRYACAGNYFTDVQPDAVRAALMATMDGWLSTDGRGRLVVKAGRYVEPTFTLTAEHIEGYTWRAFQRDEDACNQLMISYVSPEHDYTLIDAAPWRDEAAITATGRERTESLQLNWVGSHGQARRLGKRKMTRLNAERSGQIRAGIHGLNGLGRRYIRIQNPEVPSMADVVVEVLNVEIDWARARVVFDVIKADEAIDDWDPLTEEGSPPGTIPAAPIGDGYVEGPIEFDTSLAGSTVTVSWRNPASGTYFRTRIYRGATADFFAAVQIASRMGALGEEMSLTDTPGAGTWHYWVQAENADGDPSDPLGPSSETVP